MHKDNILIMSTTISEINTMYTNKKIEAEEYG